MSGSSHPWLALGTLWQRELVRFFRQRNRVLEVLLTPVLLWALLGSGLGGTFTPPTGPGAIGAGLDYLGYFFPGMVLLMVLFTAVLANITVIEDRQAGFLQGVLVSPAPRLAVVAGKVLGGASIALIQGVLLLLLWPMVGPWPGAAAAAGALGALAVIALGLTGLGFCLAWPMDSAAGFHAVMMLVLMPMWFLSGALFPPATAPGWLEAVMHMNPLAYGHAALAGALLGEAGRPLLMPAWLGWGVTLAASAGALGLAVWRVRRPDAA